MNWVDYVIIGIIASSTLIGLMRGFLRELFSFVALLGGLFVAWTFYREFAGELVGWIPNLSFRLVVAFLILLVGVLLLGTIVSRLFYILLKKKGLTDMDYTLGILFGGARGVILAAMLAFLGELTPLREYDWWRESSLIDDFRVLAEHTLARIPEQVMEKLKHL